MQDQCKIYEKRRDILVKGVKEDRVDGWRVRAASMFVWAKVAESHLAGSGTLDFLFSVA